MKTLLLGGESRESFILTQKTSSTAPLAALTCASLLWWTSLQNVPLSTMNDFGLLSVLPVSYFLALAILVVSSCVVIFRQEVQTPVFMLHLICFIVFIHATPAILYGYGNLRYSWAWKHVGIIDYIQRHHAVDPNIHLLQAYHNWPGFFTLNTLLTEVAGFDSARYYGNWAPVFFSLLDMGALLLIYRTFTRDRRLVWLGLWFFFSANWVGQEYFSPQAMNYFLHLVILGICLTWFKLKPLSKDALARWLRWGKLASIAHRILYQAYRFDPPNTEAHAKLGISLVGLMILFFIALSASHQLTPVMTVFSLIAVVIAQRCKARTLPIIFGILTILWMIFPAAPFLYQAVESFVEGLGQLGSNTVLKLGGAAAFGQQVVSIMGRVLTGGVIGLAVLGGLRQLLNRRIMLSCILLAAAPFAALGMNSYGGEIVFRVYLFAVPFAAILAAALLYPKASSGRSWLTLATTILISGAFLITFLFAYFGKERQYYFSPDEVAASEYLFEVAPPNSLIIEASLSYPTRYRNYELYTEVPISGEPSDSLASFVADPAGSLQRWMRNDDYAESFAIFTRSQVNAVDDQGQLPHGSMQEVVARIVASSNFRVIFLSKDAIILVLAESEFGAG